ncbi:MAG TPA: hypothetical protein ENG00_00010 [Candidatus Aenigmarchaeota archaeon]|nr:hypothetical protein [Candidatus Aenigmarchaeota archaeon]
MMGSVSEGARQVIEVCLGLKKDEKLTIITDRPTEKLAMALKESAERVTKRVDFFILEDFGKRPLQAVPKPVEESIKSSDASILLVQKIGNEVYTIRKPIRILGLKYGRHVNMPGVNKKVFETGLSVDYRKVWRFSKMVYRILRKSREIAVKSDSGTDIVLEISDKYRWVNSLGDMRKKGHQGTNLPGAEVFTYPSNVNGTFVVDVELGDYFSEKYGFLEKTPVYLEISDGVVTSVECENSVLKNELIKYMRADSNAGRIGEFAVGTNPFLREFIGVFLQDEKVPGVHIAIGNPYPEATGAPYTSRVHLDCITKNPTVLVDGRIIMDKGRFTLPKRY